MSDSSNKEESSKDMNNIEFTLRDGDTNLNDITLNNSSIKYGPILSEENSTQRVLNRDNLNSLNNSISYVYNTSEPNININNTIMVYGSDIKNKNPFKTGKTYSFLYLSGYPLIIIGPKCKFIFLY